MTIYKVTDRERKVKDMNIKNKKYVSFLYRSIDLTGVF